MAHIIDEEEQFRLQLLKAGGLPDEVPEIPAVDKIISDTVRQANVQTAGRDFLVLGVSSFFAFLLVLFAPMMAASAARKKNESLVTPIKKQLK